MLHDVELSDPTNYVISGPTTITPSVATPVDTSVTTVTLSSFSAGQEMLDGGSYEVTVSNVKDDSNNDIQGYPLNNEPFTGVGVAPQVDPDGNATDAYTVRIIYSEVVNAAALLPGSYDIDPPLTVDR